LKVDGKWGQAERGKETKPTRDSNYGLKKLESDGGDARGIFAWDPKYLESQKDMSVRHFLTEVTEGGTQLFDHNGRVIEHPDDCLFGKTTGLLLIGTGEDSQLQSFLFHLAQFYNRGKFKRVN